MQTNVKEPDDEATRAFSRTLEQIGDGEAHAELSEKLRDLVELIRTQAIQVQADVKGKLQLTLSLSADPKQFVHISYEVKVTEPKPPRPGSIFWITKGANLSLDNPRQQKLPLHEVPAPGEAIDVGEAR